MVLLSLKMCSILSTCLFKSLFLFRYTNGVFPNIKTICYYIACLILKGTFNSGHTQNTQPHVFFGKIYKVTINIMYFPMSLELFSVQICMIYRLKGLSSDYAMRSWSKSRYVQISDNKEINFSISFYTNEIPLFFLSKLYLLFS